MRFIWKGNWKQGEITIEAETLDELDDALKTLLSEGRIEQATDRTTLSGDVSERYPALPTGLGCSEAIRQLLSTEWGRQHPKTMRDIQNALEANALYFSSGTLSGTLNLLTKSGAIRRFKQGGRWAYVLR